MIDAKKVEEAIEVINDFKLQLYLAVKTYLETEKFYTKKLKNEMQVESHILSAFEEIQINIDNVDVKIKFNVDGIGDWRYAIETELGRFHPPINRDYIAQGSFTIKYVVEGTGYTESKKLYFPTNI